MEKDDGKLLIRTLANDELGRLGVLSSTARTVTKRTNVAGVCTLARQLMAIERARALGRKSVDFGAFALELEARRWTEERAKGKQAVRGAKQWSRWKQ